MESIFDIFSDEANQPSTFEGYLNACASKVGNLVNQYLPKASHKDINRYLYTPLRAYSENGGKRHRPLICFAAAQAVGGNPRLAASAAAAIEHFHTAALIHDDIADEAQLRRGVDCMHISEGIGLAINAGDLALSLVNGTVVQDSALSSDQKVRVISELIDMTRKTIEGQALDIGWARDGRYDITTKDYLLMATLKTAHYSGAVPLAVGAIVGGAVAAANEKNVWAGIGIGAAAGALIGTGAGAAAGIALAGTVTATTGAVVHGAGALAAVVSSGGVGAGITYISNNITHASNSLAPASQEVAQKSFDTYREMKKVLGSAGEGSQWHHIVEQCQIGKSGLAPQMVQSTNNIISVSNTFHGKISGFYSSIQPFTNGMTVRNWLAGKSFETQYAFGLYVIRLFS